MTIYTAIILGAFVTLAWCCASSEADAVGVGAAPQEQSHFMALRDLSQWTSTPGPGIVTLTSPELEAPLAWDQLILSWNALLPADALLKLEARAIYPDRATKYYTLGLWSSDPARHPRTSVKGQGDADGTVNTDTLVLKRPANRVQLRLTLDQTAPAEASVQGAQLNDPQTATLQVPQFLRFIGLNFANSKLKSATLEPNRAAWGKVIEVPQRSQVSYEGGTGWCSPTCVSMNLAHWSKVLERPELDHDVPDVARSVFDKTWGGTGNWPFNTAFAGTFPGLRAYVSRFSDVAELEDWIVAGIPVIVSVSYDLLKGKPAAKDAGHLIMCVGFTEQGDIIVNDPWARLEKGESVRKTFPRKNLVTAWANSKNTVYLIYPETATLPHDRFGHWDSPRVPGG